MYELIDEDERIDPKAVDGLMSQALMQLSIKERSAVQEEIHGVHCLALKETPEMIQESLEKLAFELDSVLHPDQKMAYIQSQRLGKTYVNQVDFRLRFLRCELFDVVKTAKRIVYFLKGVQETFGDYALKRSVRLTDFARGELKFMRRGYFQILPYRDRSGRRILVIFPPKESETIPPRIQTKILAYLVWTAGIIVDSQRQGIVTLIWVHESFQVSQVRTLIQYRFVELSPTRIASIHFCTPDTPFHLFRRSALAIRLGIYRNRLVLSAGSTVELNYILQSYGIPTDTIPITYSGTIKVTPMRQWIRLRYLLEEPDHQESAESSSIVECPYLSDIMFRQGTNACSHPGNATFRALIATKYQEFCNSKDFKSNYKQGSRIFIEGIIEDIEESQMRVINWNDKQGYWKVLNDKSLIYPKIEYIVRELRTADKARLNQQKNDSSTSLFQEMDDGNGRKFVGINQAQEPSTNNTNAVAEKDDEVGCFATCFATDSNEEAQLNGP